MRLSGIKYLVPLVIGTGALFVPLIRDFHIESAMVAAVAGTFWAGIAATRVDRFHKGDTRRVLDIVGMILLAGLPLLFNALLTGCFTLNGALLWVLFPVPGIFFGYGTGRLFRKLNFPLPGVFTFAVLLGVAVAAPAVEFFHLPQLFLFNHVWGWWPGPIYDEAVPLDGSLFAYRAITTGWILLLWGLPCLRRRYACRWIVGLAVLGLLFCYTRLEQMGIVAPANYLQEQLGGVRETEHARIWYSEGDYTGDEIERLADEIDFYVRQVENSLQLPRRTTSPKIETYLYAHPWQKKRLVGAKYTSYVTVWLPVPQIHIARGQIKGSLKHEVVHAVVALLDEPGLLPNIGLTEGIAVALDPDRSERSTIDQLVAAQKPYPAPSEMKSALSYWGFYTGRSAVSYTTTGSFVRHLLESYPPGRFVRAYETGSIEKAYPVSFERLVEGWHRKLDGIPTDSLDRRVAGELFGRLSIFEQPCPHKMPPAAKLFDRYLLHVAQNDTAGILSTLSQLRATDLSDPQPRLLWASWNLRAGRPDSVVPRADMADTLIEAQLFYADAWRMKDRHEKAERHLDRARELAVQKRDTAYRRQLAIRSDSVQWEYDLRIRYDHALPDTSAFDNAYYLLKIRSIRNALEREQHETLAMYARRLLALPINLRYYNVYLDVIHRLSHKRFFILADAWIQKLSGQDLRPRYRERLEQERDWLAYMRDRPAYGPD